MTVSEQERKKTAERTFVSQSTSKPDHRVGLLARRQLGT